MSLRPLVASQNASYAGDPGDALVPPCSTEACMSAVERRTSS
jgi:hypothetical protein